MRSLYKFLFFHFLTCFGLEETIGSEIIHGKKVPEQLMLYMASVQDSSGHHVCGGFLIAEDLVVTAAHCQHGNPTNVVLGAHDLNKIDNDTNRYTAESCLHPRFANSRTGNDIMLLKLSKKVKMDKNVQKIRFPNSDIKIKDNAKCRVAGWGFTRNGGKTVNVLQVVDVPFVNLKVCKAKWHHFGLDLPDSAICAGGYGSNKGFCKGDSGGPLVCGGMAVGVVSFNMRNNCDYPTIPNIYTNISKYRHWIKDKKRECKM
ncbi:mast cell protease 3-like [Antennarius striatus]|uniref:mast cell protease 3-like n=1 Tax=Antennarius striatus TaxID=241820 RepID=UPI0035ADCC56